jgi:hypothetical protein
MHRRRHARIQPSRLTWNLGASETSDREFLMSELPGRKQKARDLRALSDPELITQWAAVRNLLCRTPESKPEHREIKQQYDAAVAEYRRRIDGGSFLVNKMNDRRE